MGLYEDAPALGKTWVLNAQWTDCPKEVKDEIREIWSHYELGNDNYIWKTSIADLLENQKEQAEEECGWMCPPSPNLITYLRAHSLSEDEEVWLHYWW